MSSRMIICCLVLICAALLAISSCSGVLMESKHEDGRVERLKIDQGEGWENYEDKPRYPSTKKNTLDEMCIMLKKEMTF
jgi:hypothetical protein